MKFIRHTYIVVQVSSKRWQVAESWHLGGEVTYKGVTCKHFKAVGQRFGSWDLAHEYAGQLEDAQRQALEMTPILDRHGEAPAATVRPIKKRGV